MGEANFYYFTCLNWTKSGKMFYKNKPVPIDLKTPIYPGAPSLKRFMASKSTLSPSEGWSWSPPAGSSAFRVPENLQKTRELQKLFLASDGKVPVHLARGARDVMAYKGTMGLCTIGMAYWGYLMYRMAYGIK